MKKNFLLLILFFSFWKFTAAQILCIYCYDQNDSISVNVNNLLLNGGFESSTCTPASGVIGALTSFCPNSNGYACDIYNWTCTGGGVNTYACLFDNNYSVIAEGTKALYFGNYYCSACSGNLNDTSCVDKIDCADTGIPAGYPQSGAAYGVTTGVSLEQTVTGLTPGNTYVLEFWAGGEYLSANNKEGLFGVDVGFGDTLLRDTPTQEFSADIGKRYIIEFNATSSSHTIKFTNWGHICSACTELVLDDVRLYTLAQLSPLVPNCVSGTDIPDFENPVYVYPNPARNELNVKANRNELSQIILYDFTSGKLLQQEFTGSVSINTESLAKGIYIYEIRPVPISPGNKKGAVSKGKVVKE